MELPADAPPPYRTILLDVDSTLVGIEGIDALAGPIRPEVAELTRRAMSGALALEEVYGRRLELVRPTRAALLELGRLYVRELLPGARELVAGLRALGKRVCLASGGLEPAVLALAQALGLERRDVFAVGIEFDRAGNYAGFDARSPLARSGGKRALVEELARDPGARPIALVGDGMSDLEAAASPALARFVAFGGVVRREEVFARARVHVEGRDLDRLFACLLAEHERLAERAAR